jgi:site-specific DNA-methyltransferase (adenine-specific)|tara:strand:+ start:2201 stop:2626 length:426 start_codon:yes stop_codon:yes gene_type:complete
MNKGLFTSNKDDWETPQDLFDRLNEEFDFRLDVCANAKNAKCGGYFNKKDNGLNKSWWLIKGYCWCNPPYGRQIIKWVEKAYMENKLNGARIVMLLPARTDTRYFHDYIYGKAEIRFIKGRLKFSDSKNSAPFPSMLVVYN